MVRPGASAPLPPSSSDSPADPQPDLSSSTRRPWYRKTWRHALATLLASAALGGSAGQVYVWFADGTGDGPSAAVGSSGAVSRTATTAEFAPSDRGAALEIAGTTLDGDDISTRELRGQVVFINVWGSWCAPCRKEAPVLKAASRAYDDEGVSFLGINVRDNRAAAEAFESRYGITYPSIADADGRMLSPLNDYVPANAVPVSVVLDTEGRVAARAIGALDKSTLAALVDNVLSEDGAPDPGAARHG